jgi:hypothetical protein
MKRIVWLVVLLSLSGQAWSKEWKGHLATLWDAQVACSDTNRNDCEPFLAEAVAVADVMNQLSTVDMEEFRFLAEIKCTARTSGAASFGLGLSV